MLLDSDIVVTIPNNLRPRHDQPARVPLSSWAYKLVSRNTRTPDGVW